LTTIQLVMECRLNPRWAFFALGCKSHFFVWVHGSFFQLCRTYCAKAAARRRATAAQSAGAENTKRIACCSDGSLEVVCQFELRFRRHRLSSRSWRIRSLRLAKSIEGWLRCMNLRSPRVGTSQSVNPAGDRFGGHCRNSVLSDESKCASTSNPGDRSSTADQARRRVF